MQTDLLFGERPPTISLEYLRSIRDAYKFSRVDSRAILFRCQDDLYSTHTMNGQMGWDGLFTEGLEVIETPGEHASLLQDPYIQELANRIDDRLGHSFAQEVRYQKNANYQLVSERV
jgi:thioesterase domain-containing protein